MKMKKTLFTILLGASLIFGNLNKAKAQECECQTYNHDADEFPEEIICWKKEGFNYYNFEPNQDKAGVTIIYYSDNNNDNFHENIRTFNYGQVYKYLSWGYLNIEFFNIQKETGTINYSWRRYGVKKMNWNNLYSKESVNNLITKEIPKYLRPIGEDFPNLTKEQLYSLYPNSWMFYGGFGERTKKLISAGKNLEEIKKMVNNERNLWGYEIK